MKKLSSRMFNYRLVIEYNGEKFFGSQKQNLNAETYVRTVQAELEKVLESYFKEDINTVFSGRTDRGVHAIDQVVNFKTEEAFKDPFDKLLLRFNALLPDDLVIVKIEEAAEDFNARFDAVSREYLYKIFVRRHKPVLRTDSLGWFKDELDFEKMQEHCKSYIGKKDFAAYAKEEKVDFDPNSDKFQVEKTTICEVYEAELIKESKFCFKFKIKANRFLRNMVRRMVGELVHIGKGNEESEVSSKQTAPAAGLTLIKVEY